MRRFQFTVGQKVVPGFLYGTAWKDERTARCVEEAIAAGFRGIDTANQRKHYFEAGVGRALQTIFAAGDLQREDLFIQTKFTEERGQDHRLPYDRAASPADKVRQSLASSLEHLGIDYLDSFILHGPSVPYGLSRTDWETWRAMEECQREGKVELLGISNVSHEQLEELWGNAAILPAFVQNRCFARTGWDRHVRHFCREQGIIYQGFSLLTANPEIFHDPGFGAIVERTGATPAQVVFRFALGIGMLPLTGTTDPAHMREDLACVDLELDRDELATIESLAG